MLLEGYAIDAAVEECTAADFYRPSHGHIFDACVELHTNGEPVDVITAAAELDRRGLLEEIGGRQRLHDLMALIPLATKAGHYARLVRETAVRRALIEAGRAVAAEGRDGHGTLEELIDRSEQAVFGLRASRGRQQVVYLADTLTDAFKRLDELQESDADVLGTPTGFKVVDDITAGLQPGNLVVAAGRPSMGKSAFALTVALNNALQGRPVAIFTAEMSRSEITHRALAVKAMVELQRLRKPRTLETQEWKRLFDAHKHLHDAPLLIDDSKVMTVLDIRARARRARMKHPDLALVIVDYLQLLKTSERTENRVQEISAITRSLKIMAGDLDVPVLALSQLSRQVEQRHDKRPLLSDLRESGAIEQDADTVMLLYRDEYYNPEDAIEDGTEGVCEVNVAKQRNGPTGTVKVAFVKKFAMFGDLYREGTYT